jgi:tetratricopeptide (TPR) repeat protein
LARIFLSHSSRDNPQAVALRDWLTAEGWDDLFLDLDPSRGIAAGERWERRLHEAANRCEAILFLVSRAWLASDWCLREFRLAQKLNKRSFGILIEPIPIADLPAELTVHWQFVDLAQGADHRIFRAVLPDGAESHVTFSTAGLKRLKAGLTRSGLDARFFQWPPEDDADRPPYRGLRPLEAGDAGIFFGREAPTIEALDRLRGIAEATPPRFVVILGASGAGKSSFLRAGLLPRLARDDRAFLPLPIVRPERAAISGDTGLIRSLEAAAASAGVLQSRAGIKAAIEDGAPAVAALLAALAEKVRAPAGTNESRPHPPRIVLAIDQAEELFLAEGAAEAGMFLRLLHDLASDPASNLIVIATIRSDAYERLQTAPALEGVRQEAVSLPPMPKGAYQTVIEGPAARLAETRRPLKVEPALTAALLHDVEQGGAKDALPLLAFTLERLYLEHGGDGDLRLSEYRQVGGIRGSIDAAVEGALRGADSDPAVPRDRAAREALLRRMLIPWLAGIDPETGTPRRRIARLSEIPEEARPLVTHLVASRLLATDRNPDTSETTVEPAHEALLRQWGLLQSWLEEDFAALSTLESVKRAARDWDANALAGDWLAHAAGRLDDAEALLARDDFAASLEPADRAYLAAARAADTARRDREVAEARKLAAAEKQAAGAARDAADKQRMVARRTRIGLVAASVLAILAAGAAWYGISEAQRADAAALYAGQQAHLAIAERDRADQNFAAAKQTINGLIFDIADGLRNATGMRVETIGNVLETVRATVQELSQTAPDDPELKKSQIWMYGFFADTYLAAGAVPKAIEVAEAGLSIARELAGDDRGVAENQRDLAIILIKVADAKVRAGDRSGAVLAQVESLEIVRRIVFADPPNLEAQRDLALALEKMGDLLLQAGDRDGALGAHNESLSIRRTLASHYPQGDRLQRDLAVSYSRVGDIVFQSGDSTQALASYKSALSIARSNAEAALGNTEAQRDLMSTLGQVASVLVHLRHDADALAICQEILLIARLLAKADPTSAEAQRDLSVGLGKVGGVRLQMGDTAGALAAYEESAAVSRLLRERDPDNAQGERDLGASIYRLGNLRFQLGDHAGALTAYNESLSISRHLAALDPVGVQAQRDLVASLYKVGSVMLSLDGSANAASVLEEALVIARTLAVANPENSQVQTELATLLVKAAEVSDNPATNYQEAISILASLDAEGSLSSEQQGWIRWIKRRLSTLDEDQAEQTAE